jgi:Domain of unknown function (DUF4173)
VTSRQRLALALFLSAPLLGAAGDFLFQGRPIGINALLFSLAFVVALAILLRIGEVPMHQGRRMMVVPLILFAGMLAWHDSPLLLATNLLAVAGAVTLGALRRSGGGLRNFEVTDYVAGAASAGAATFAGTIELMEKDLPWERIGATVRSNRSAALGRGLALSLPFLVLFGGLFVAADAVFRSLIVGAVPDLRHVWSHLLIAAGVAWLSAGLLRDLVASRDAERLVAPTALSASLPRLRLGSTEVAAALAALNVLFLAFVIVQVRYLFGGQGLVEARLHLTYAQYARHGFFELVVVAVLMLPVLLVANAVVRERRHIVRGLSALLIGLVFVVLASALDRMRLYQREYGLTELRLYATGLILWLGVVLVWFALTVVRGRPRAFAFGAILAGFAATVALNAVNPDALIARTNLGRPQVDVAYLGRLSDDAVPELLDRLPTLAQPRRGALAAALLRRSEPSGGLLGWNASRARAGRLLRKHRVELLADAGAIRIP